jgi:hypothetical protein
MQITTAGARSMSALRHKRTFGSSNAMSALPPKADTAQTTTRSALCQKRPIAPLQ